MPSHKHKKKKKTHKRSKRHSSSSSEDSPWRVPVSDADSDESSNQERLTPLVRRTYMSNLKQALTLNFEDCNTNLSEPNSESIEEMVHRWSSVLEQKAMRTCMISELYRTSMASLIRQIKTSTSHKQLFIEDKSFSRLKSRIPASKGSQTVASELSQEVQTQTDWQIPSLLELPLPKSSPCNRPYDPAIDFSDSNSSDGGVSSSLGSKQHQAASVVCGSQDICNISSTSDLDIAKQPVREDRVPPNMDNNFIQRSPIPLKSESSKFNTHISNMQCSTEIPESMNMNTHDINSSNEYINNSAKKLITIKKRQASIENVSPSLKNNLDERLSAMGLFVDNGEDSLPQPPEKSKRSNWFAEETAQSCNLTRILMRMTTRQREKVLKEIKEIFGEENGPLTELSEENINICRKRIASVVVMELTPVYQAKRIGSRHLFKFLAKKITKSIMDKSLAPDTKNIRWRVKKYFEDGKIIMSESDCI